MTAGEWVALVVAVVAIVLADLRWLRVAQREHYLPGSTSLFVRRWWYKRQANLVLWIVALLGFVASAVFSSLLVIPAAVVAIGPLGLSVKGRTSKLAWTRRLKTLAMVTFGAQALALLALALVTRLPAATAVVIALIAPTFVELALGLTARHERKQANEFVAQAKKRLASMSPKIVAITGSYGKTSTKVAVAHLLAASRSVVASPASFNNRAGISRTLNEHLVPGTDALVVEMGTYGPGEIAELCEMCPPDVAVLTAIGPVHLERFGNEAAIIAAKAEIFEDAPVAVVNVDDDRLGHLASRLAETGKKVWRCSTGADADVVLSDGRLVVRGELVAENVSLGTPSNIACAVAVALELGVEPGQIAARLGTIPSVSHRREVTKNDKGVTVIDDTYNLNPAGARLALAELVQASAARRILVTPGMVELGRRQHDENKDFAAAAGAAVSDLVVVGHTNRRALLEGVGSTPDCRVVLVPTLPKAVEWVRTNATEGDAVLYANDLPDHYS